mgnify:FL=1
MFNKSYQCYVQSMTFSSKDDRSLTNITGFNQFNKTDSDVTSFIIAGKHVNFFPRSITKFFKNIQHVSIGFTYIEKLTKYDLQQFRKKLTFNQH